MRDDRSVTVLYVDTNPRLRELVETSLERERETFNVVTRADTNELRSSLESSTIDCVVGAHRPPKLDALELLETLREEYPQLPFVLFADISLEGILAEVVSAGVTEYIEESDEQLGALADSIERAIDGRAIDGQEHGQTASRPHQCETVLQTMSAAVFLKDVDGRYLLMNETCRALFDLEESTDVTGLTDEDLFALDQSERSRERDRRVVETGETVEGEIDIPRVDTETDTSTDTGTKKYLIRQSPVYRDGTVEAICGVLTDITEQKQRERELEQYRQYLEHSPDIMVVLDEDGKVEYQSSFRVGGGEVELAGCAGEPFLKAIHPDDVEKAQKDFEQALDSPDEVVLSEFRVRTTDGEWVWLESRAHNYIGEEPVGGILVSVRDISQQKAYQSTLEALHEAATAIQQAKTVEEACERTVEVSANILSFYQCVVVLREGEWLVPYARSEATPSGGARRMHVTEGLAGKTFQTGESYIVDDVAQDDTSKPAKETYRSGLSVPIGEYGVLQATSTDVSGFDAEDLALAELLCDHTASTIARIEREQRLARKKERLNEFASFVSHDLRNPLNVAMLRLDLLEDECDSEHIDHLDAALERMDQLIEDLLTLARQGETVGETEAVDLAELAARCWTTVETNCAHLEIAVEGTVQADKSRLSTVLENLFSNAIDHGGDDVTVTIGNLPDERGFYVADDGDGIDETDREQLFESGYSTRDDGTGIGLAIVKQIVRAHGWSIDVTESEDGGARFEVSGMTVE